MDKETLIRVIVAAGLVMAMYYAYQAFFMPARPAPGERPEAPAEQPAAPGQEKPEGEGEAHPAGEAEPEGEGQAEEPPPDAGIYALVAAGDDEPADPVVLGSDLPIGRYDLEAEVHPTGAAVRRLTLARRQFFKKVDDRDLPPEKREPLHLVDPQADEPALAVEELRLRLDGREGWGKVDLADVPWRVTEVADDHSSAVFEVDVQDADGSRLATVRRQYVLQPRGTVGGEAEGEPVPQYELHAAVEIVARDPRVQKAYYVLHGPPALPREGQRRDYRGAVVGLWGEGKVDVERYEGKDDGGPRIGPEMAWIGQEDKYFTVVLIPLVASPDGGHVMPGSRPASGTFAAGGEVSGRTVTEGRKELALPVVRLESKAVALDPGAPVRHELAVFAGPKDPGHLEAYYQEIGLDKLVVWSQCCSFFAPISRVLLTVVEAFHAVVGNWGVAIIMLVIALQIVLLPVTKWSAKSMAQMQSMAPKMQEIREKYASDQKKMQEELAKIGGFKAFGGCLPMFVQMPIWIGLYGALLVAIQLRHSAFLPAAWIPAGSLFLQDLSAPDALVHWAAPLYLPGQDIPLLGWVIGGIQSMLGGGGGITSFTILPIAVGLLMYVQQKLMPSASGSAAANPQAQQQQKMMMRFMPIFLGVVLYSAPSGLCLYIMTSSLIRLVENKFFRHRWIEAAKAKVDRAEPPEPPGESGKAAARQSRVAGRRKSIGERAEAWFRGWMDEARKGTGPARKGGKRKK